MTWLQHFILSREEMSFPMYFLTMCAGIFVALVVLKLMGALED